MDQNSRWKQLPEPFARYFVSDDGRIWDAKRSRYPKIQRGMLAGGRPGYMKIPMMAEVMKYVSVHRLVAAAFVPGDQALEVNHKDLDKTNNHFANLEWVTHRANIQHGLRTHAEWAARLNEAAKKRRRPVMGTAPNGFEQRFESIGAAARWFGHPNKAGNICRALLSGRAIYGLSWRYL